jgi:hypothetical protein
MPAPKSNNAGSTQSTVGQLTAAAAPRAVNNFVSLPNYYRSAEMLKWQVGGSLGRIDLPCLQCI